MTEAELVVSTQVLSEFYVTVTKKLGSPLDAESACEAVRHLSELDVVGVDAELVGAAIELHQAHSVSYWDALIVESAARAGCGTILTEDLNHGSTLRGAAIINPFVD